MGSKARRVALLCAILAAHLVLFLRVSVDSRLRFPRSPKQPPAVLLWIELPSADEAQSVPRSPRRLESARNRPGKVEVDPEIAISVLPDIDGVGTSVDWGAEAQRAASDAAKRERDKITMRQFDQHPASLGPLPPKSSAHKRGDSEHFVGGEIVDWVSSNCYYSNLNAPDPTKGQALRLQIPTCKGSSTDPMPTLEEWKKDWESR